MTNKEKYLKDNVSVEELAMELAHHIQKRFCTSVEQDIKSFMKEQTKPTLTEDERVILRNIDTERYPKIARKDKQLGIINVYTDGLYWLPFQNLFQFIKERRRILNRRIVRR